MSTIYSERNGEHFLAISTDSSDVRCEICKVWHEEADGEIYTDDLVVATPSEAFLNAVADARLGRVARISGNNPREEVELSTRSIGVHKGEVTNQWPSPISFDPLFLDTFSVVENSEPRKRTARDIVLTSAEKVLLDIVAKNMGLVHNFSPREFEVLVGAMLTRMGFSRVKLSRFVKDTGFDLFAVYFEGETEYSTIVEVKQYSDRTVGLAIVDRLNGVRDRMGVDKGVVFTTSSFSADARRFYTCSNSRIALIDFEKLQEMIAGCSNHWKMTPSGLWTLRTQY